MNDDVHPVIRIGGPILGFILLTFVINSMVSQFQADLDQMLSEPARQEFTEVSAEEPTEATGAAEETEEPEDTSDRADSTNEVEQDVEQQ